jgi:hypothetical protein
VSGKAQLAHTECERGDKNSIEFHKVPSDKSIVS